MRVALDHRIHQDRLRSHPPWIISAKIVGLGLELISKARQGSVNSSIRFIASLGIPKAMASLVVYKAALAVFLVATASLGGSAYYSQQLMASLNNKVSSLTGQLNNSTSQVSN